MKKILFIIAFFAAIIPAKASGIKFYEPWRLVLDSNEKIYTVQYVIQTDSDFRGITLDDTLIFNSEPNFRCNQAIIVNTQTGHCDQLYRNEDITTLLLFLGGLFLFVWIITVFLVVLICKK